MTEKPKPAGRTVVAPGYASPIGSAHVLSIEVDPDEEVEWVWNHDRERGSYVAGYRIVPRVLVENRIHSLDKQDSTVDARWLKEMEDRLEAYRSGKLPSVDAGQVLAELSKRT